LVLEIGRKVGRYDGAERWRLNARYWCSYRDGIPVQFDAKAGTTVAIPASRLYMVKGTDLLMVSAMWAGGSWTHEFPTLRSDLSEYRLGAVVVWHWQRYYRFLPPTEVGAIADEFTARRSQMVSDGLTLAEVNRMASRELYRLARNLGWRKMTQSEQQRYRLDGQWHRVETVERRRVDMGYPPSGCGQYTIDAASGSVAMQGQVEGDREEVYEEEYLTSYGIVGEDIA
jgi:hypothetical protein